MGRNVGLGDSIVRSYHIHDQELFSIEQDISVCCVKVASGFLGKYFFNGGSAHTNRNQYSHGLMLENLS